MEKFPHDFQETVREKRKSVTDAQQLTDENVMKNLRQGIFNELCEKNECVFEFPDKKSFRPRSKRLFLAELIVALPDADIYYWAPRNHYADEDKWCEMQRLDDAPGCWDKRYKIVTDVEKS